MAFQLAEVRPGRAEGSRGLGSTAAEQVELDHLQPLGLVRYQLGSRVEVLQHVEDAPVDGLRFA